MEQEVSLVAVGRARKNPVCGPCMTLTVVVVALMRLSEKLMREERGRCKLPRRDAGVDELRGLSGDRRL